MSAQLFELCEKVTDETSFLVFVRALLQDRYAAEPLPQTQDGFQGEWANQTLSSFIEASLAWAEASNFGARPGPKSTNPWSLFAEFLWAGRCYE